jgi:hypothetical protein
MLLRRRAIAPVLLIAAALIGSGCSGETLGASKTGTSTTLKANAKVSCDGGTPVGCRYYFEVKHCSSTMCGGGSTTVRGPYHVHVKDYVVSETISFPAYHTTSYRICGRGDNIRSNTCANWVSVKHPTLY